MKYALVTLLFLAPAVTSVAVAQDGGGHGPPSSPVIVPNPITLPTQPATTTTTKSLSAHVGASLEEMAPAISESRRRTLRSA
jgi:hypothetical protein